MDAVDEIVAEFLVESHENLDQLDRDLLALEQDPSSRDLLASVFRTIHTIKGTSGFLAFGRLERLTHVGESLLSRLRDGEIALTDQRSSALLRMVDAIRELLRAIEQTGAEPELDGDPQFAALVADLAALVDDAPAEPDDAPAGSAEPPAGSAEPPAESAEAPAAPAAKQPATRRTPAKRPAAKRPAKPKPESKPESKPEPNPQPEPEPKDEAKPGAPLGEMLVAAGETTPDAVELARMEQGLGDPRLIGSILVEHGQASPAAVQSALTEQRAGHPGQPGQAGPEQTPASPDRPGSAPSTATGLGDAGGEAHRSLMDSSVRVDVDLLDSLMRLVGELVLSRNQLVSKLEAAAGGEGASPTAKGIDAELGRAAQRLSLVTSELQEQVMRTRMQPVDSVWNKLPRVVRDLAKQLGRQVRVEMSGRETELDRGVLEAIKDPLTHLVRNAIDHGIESPEQRVAAGKPAEGLLRLRAYHEAGQVHLEIIDDGAGIDPQRIAAKAIERGLVTEAQAAGLGEREIIQMIFLPGFSTAASVTNVSGRGVGMDVVKTRIEAIGGSVEVTSRLGAGSVFRLTIPLTLAIIPALTIGCDGRRYAVPQVSVLELVRLSGEHARGGIELISGAPVYRLRDMLLPLVRLDEQLGLVPADQAAAEAAPSGQAADGADAQRGGYIVVLQAEQTRFGLVVDDVLDTQEIVVKPLGKHLKQLPAYAGATILGDGSVVLILDATTLARRANVLQASIGSVSAQQAAEAEPVEPVLVVDVGADRRAAIPLAAVTRLEELPVDSVESVGSREVVQYRGQIMPLVRLARLLGGSPSSAAGSIADGAPAAPGQPGALGEPGAPGLAVAAAEPRLQMVVYTRGSRSVGFVVDRILDIAAERPGTRSDIDDTALVGSVVVGERVVELVDVERLVRAADPHFYDNESEGADQ